MPSSLDLWLNCTFLDKSGPKTEREQCWSFAPPIPCHIISTRQDDESCFYSGKNTSSSYSNPCHNPSLESVGGKEALSEGDFEAVICDAAAL